MSRVYNKQQYSTQILEVLFKDLESYNRPLEKAIEEMKLSIFQFWPHISEEKKESFLNTEGKKALVNNYILCGKPVDNNLIFAVDGEIYTKEFLKNVTTLKLLKSHLTNTFYWVETYIKDGEVYFNSYSTEHHNNGIKVCGKNYLFIDEKQFTIKNGEWSFASENASFIQKCFDKMFNIPLIEALAMINDEFLNKWKTLTKEEKETLIDEHGKGVLIQFKYKDDDILNKMDILYNRERPHNFFHPPCKTIENLDLNIYYFNGEIHLENCYSINCNDSDCECSF